MHDLLNNILNIISLVVHTIVRPIIEKRGSHRIADYDTENFHHSKEIKGKEGNNDEKNNASKRN